MAIEIRSENKQDYHKTTEIKDSLIQCKCIAIALVLICWVAAGSLFSQISSNPNQVTPKFFGADFWGYDPQLWQQFLTLLDEDTVQFGLIGFGYGWEQIEPNPPGQGKHTYDWSVLDSLIGAVEASGRVIDLELMCRSEWATTVPASMLDELCCDMSPIKEDADSDTSQWGMTAYQAWGDFVFNLVERYDADGVDDAPGITQPAIRYLQLGNEPDAVGHFVHYGGTPELYDSILDVMYGAVKSASPSIAVVRGKSNPAHIFDDDPDETTLQIRRADYLDFVSTSLRLGKNHFDIFAINFNDHYTGLFPFVRWLTSEMEKNGYVKPFLVGDARTSAYPRGNDEAFHILPPRYPAGFIETLRDPSHPQYETNRRLYHADEARQSLRKLLVALASEQEAISLQPAIGPAFHPRDLWQDATLIDTRIWQATADIHKARKPVYYAAKQLIDALVGANRPVEILDLGPDVFAYQVNNQGKQLLLLWHENPFDVDAQGLLRRNQQVTVDLSSVVAASQLRVTHFVTELDSARSPIYPPDVTLSVSEVSIDETPALVEAVVATPVREDNERVLSEFVLYQNYPNPFNPETVISYQLSAVGKVELTIYDVTARRVRTLVRGMQNAGDHTVTWDGHDDRGQAVASGVYLFRLSVGELRQLRRLVLLR